MDYAYRNIYIRPNTSVPFYEQSAELNQYIQTAYKDTNKVLSSSVELSSDGLTQIRSIAFASEADWVEFCNDPQIFPMFEERRIYNETNGIVQVREVIS